MRPKDRPIDSKQDYPRETICQLHRQIYRNLKNAGYEEQADEIQWLRRAFEYAKRMNWKLRQYKEDYADEWYEQNKTRGGELAGDP